MPPASGPRGNARKVGVESPPVPALRGLETVMSGLLVADEGGGGGGADPRRRSSLAVLADSVRSREDDLPDDIPRSAPMESLDMMIGTLPGGRRSSLAMMRDLTNDGGDEPTSGGDPCTAAGDGDGDGDGTDAPLGHLSKVINTLPGAGRRSSLAALREVQNDEARRRAEIQACGTFPALGFFVECCGAVGVLERDGVDDVAALDYDDAETTTPPPPPASDGSTGVGGGACGGFDPDSLDEPRDPAAALRMVREVSLPDYIVEREERRAEVLQAQRAEARQRRRIAVANETIRAALATDRTRGCLHLAYLKDDTKVRTDDEALQELCVQENTLRKSVVGGEHGEWVQLEKTMEDVVWAFYALPIQRCLRVYLARRVVSKKRRLRRRDGQRRDRREDVDCQAVLIQKVFRGFLARSRLPNRRRDVAADKAGEDIAAAQDLVRRLLSAPAELLLGGIPNPGFSYCHVEGIGRRAVRADIFEELLTVPVPEDTGIYAPRTVTPHGGLMSYPEMCATYNWVVSLRSILCVAPLSPAVLQRCCEPLLIIAAAHGRPEIVEFLLDLGVSPLCKRERLNGVANALSPMMAAAYTAPHTVALYRQTPEDRLASRLRTLEILAAADTSAMSQANDLGATCMHYAMLAFDPAVFNKVVALGGDPVQLDFHRRTPLHYACAFPTADEARMAAVLDELWRTHAFPLNFPDEWGNTPLHYTARSLAGSKVIVMLMKHGAVADQPNKANLTPVTALETFRERVKGCAARSPSTSRTAQANSNPLRAGGEKLSQCLHSLKYFIPVDVPIGRRALRPDIKLELTQTPGVDVPSLAPPQRSAPTNPDIRHAQRKQEIMLKNAVYAPTADAGTLTYGGYVDELCQRNGLKPSEVLLGAVRAKHTPMQDLKVLEVTNAYLAAKYALVLIEVVRKATNLRGLSINALGFSNYHTCLLLDLLQNGAFVGLVGLDLRGNTMGVKGSKMVLAIAQMYPKLTRLGVDAGAVGASTVTKLRALLQGRNGDLRPPEDREWVLLGKTGRIDASALAESDALMSSVVGRMTSSGHGATLAPLTPSPSRR